MTPHFRSSSFVDDVKEVFVADNLIGRLTDCLPRSSSNTISLMCRDATTKPVTQTNRTKHLVAEHRKKFTINLNTEQACKIMRKMFY